MSLVASVDDGAEMVRQLLKYDGVIVSRVEFGRLTFCLDVAEVPLIVAQDFIDRLEEIDCILGNVYISPIGTIDFDYYVTADLLSPIRAAVDRVTRHGGKLSYWAYSGR